MWLSILRIRIPKDPTTTSIVGRRGSEQWFVIVVSVVAESTTSEGRLVVRAECIRRGRLLLLTTEERIGLVLLSLSLVLVIGTKGSIRICTEATTSCIPKETACVGVIRGLLAKKPGFWLIVLIEKTSSGCLRIAKTRALLVSEARRRRIAEEARSGLSVGGTSISKKVAPCWFLAEESATSIAKSTCCLGRVTETASSWSVRVRVGVRITK